jgi:hypothetical protein
MVVMLLHQILTKVTSCKLHSSKAYFKTLNDDDDDDIVPILKA